MELLGKLVAFLPGSKNFILSLITFLSPILVSSGVLPEGMSAAITEWVVANWEIIISSLGALIGLLRIVTYKPGVVAKKVILKEEEAPSE